MSPAPQRTTPRILVITAAKYRIDLREQFVAAFLEAADDARTAGAPRSLERRVGEAGRRRALGVDDGMEVGADLRERVLRGPALKAVERAERSGP
jgi:hypothetical protein